MLVVTLNPFYCHEDITVELGNSTIVLLHGKSGSGKSTLLDAIEFALYGGKCDGGKYRVQLEDDVLGYSVIRTSSPAHVVLQLKEGVELSDTNAEHAICNLFGTRDQFRMASYVKQDERNYFFMCSRPEKMRLLETIAYMGTSESLEYEVKLREINREVSSAASSAALDAAIAERDMTSHGEAEEQEGSIDDLTAHMEECEKRAIDKARENQDAQRDSDARIKLSKEIESLHKKMDESRQRTMDDGERDAISSRLDDIEGILATSKVTNVVRDALIDQIESLRTEANITARTDIEQRLLRLTTKVEDCDEWNDAMQKSGCATKAEYEDRLKSLEEEASETESLLSSLDERMQELTSMAGMVDGKVIFACVACDTKLSFDKRTCSVSIADEHTTHEDAATIADDIKATKGYQVEALKRMRKIKETRDTLTSCRHAFNRPIPRKSKSEYENKIRCIRSYMAKVAEKASLEGLKLLSPAQNESLLAEKSRLKAALSEHDKALRTVASHEAVLRDKTQQLDTIPESSVDREGYDACTLEAEKARDAVNKKRRRLRYEELRRLRDDAKNKLDFLRGREHTCTLVKQKLSEAKSIYLHKTLSVINDITQEYVDSFFPNDPILVLFNTFSTNKKDEVRYEFDLSFNYKGRSNVSWASLSGGERVRISLALTLAINRMSNIPYLFLDESVGSVEPSLREHLFDVLKEYSAAHGKIIVCASHMEVSGDFDQTIAL